MEDISFYLIGIISHVVFLVIFICLYFVEKKKCILLWFYSWLFFLFAHLGTFLEANTGYATLFGLIENIFYVLGIWAVTKGALLFFRGRIPKFITITSIILIAYYFVISLMSLANIFHITPRFVHAGSLLIFTGIISIRVAYLKSISRFILGACFILWGFCNILFLFGYIFGRMLFLISFTYIAVFSVATTICIQTVYFQYCREKHAIIQRKYKLLIDHDKQTGIYNRTFCEREMDKIDNDEQLPISVILGNLNGLKLVNNIFGNKKGDQLLAGAAKIMKSVVQENIIGRWGEDKLIIILPRTGKDQAMEILWEIKDKCREYQDGNVVMEIALGTATKEKPEETLTEIIKIADSKLHSNKLAESGTVRKSMVHLLKNALLEKNIETEEHVLRMKETAYLVGRNMDLSVREQDDLALAAFLHDIGKISIPDHILNKPGALSPEEWKIMKQHSEMGYRVTLASEEFVHISHSVLSHHERWDGKGYPQGLKGEEIPLAARIISVIDAYDAMTHNRIYKKAMTSEDALIEIERCAGTQFDPNVCKLFVKIMRESKPEILQKRPLREAYTSV